MWGPAGVWRTLPERRGDSLSPWAPRRSSRLEVGTLGTELWTASRDEAREPSDQQRPPRPRMRGSKDNAWPWLLQGGPQGLRGRGEGGHHPHFIHKRTEARARKRRARTFRLELLTARTSDWSPKFLPGCLAAEARAPGLLGATSEHPGPEGLLCQAALTLGRLAA